MRKTIIIGAALAAIAAATPALAQDGTRLNVPQDKWMTPAEIKSKLESQGYKVTEIESDDGAYEVDMTDKDGTFIDTHVHPETGELLPGYDN